MAAADVAEFPAAKQPTTSKKAPAAKRPAKSAKTAAAKKSARKSSLTSAKSPRKQAVESTGAAEPSDSEIQLRAYFLAEKRLKHGLAGDSAHDWLEAKRQLLEEAAQR